MRFDGKVVVITGAASGIGRATAVLFAKEGAMQVLADINDHELNDTMALLPPEAQECTTTMKADVANAADVKAIMDEAVEKYGKIDVVVANAGIVRVGQVEEFPDEDYDLLINVNMKGTFYTCKFAAPYLKQQHSGSVILLSSVSAHIGQPNHANYASTKAGILGFMRAFAMDMAPFNVRVNSVSPGSTDTPMLVSDCKTEAATRGIDWEEVKHEREQEGVIPRWATPEEIGFGILFLASEESSYMTGTDLRMDGGWTAR